MLKYDDKWKFEAHLQEFNELIRELNDGGGKPTELLSVYLLLLSLPKSYDNIVTALETLEEGCLTLNFVKGKLLLSNKIEIEYTIGTEFTSNARKDQKFKFNCYK